MDRNFGGVIWTNHALKRLRERGIKQGDAWATFQRPEESRFAKVKGAWVYYRTWPSTGSGQGEKIEVVAKPPAQRAYGPEGKKWVILSVWSSRGYDVKMPAVKESFWKFLFKRIFQ